VCSGPKADLVRSLGADHVIDYTDQGFAGGDRIFDLVIDIGGGNPVSRLRRTLKPWGRLVIVGGEGDRWIGVHRQLWASLMSLFVRQKLGTFIVKENARDLQFLNGLIEAGQVKPVIDRTYPLGAAPDAVRYFESGRATGRIALVCEPTRRVRHDPSERPGQSPTRLPRSLPEGETPPGHPRPRPRLEDRCCSKIPVKPARLKCAMKGC
jgi:D-arabinose 1-dehydrogenase-like Zn-dependent alcohol dehydrogenase